MLPFLKLRKSGGIPVSISVHRLTAAGNIARDARRWMDAASAYRSALECDASLGHIWLQYGHALKELESFVEAEAAYVRRSNSCLAPLNHTCTSGIYKRFAANCAPHGSTI